MTLLLLLLVLKLLASFLGMSFLCLLVCIVAGGFFGGLLLTLMLLLVLCLILRSLSKSDCLFGSCFAESVCCLVCGSCWWYLGWSFCTLGVTSTTGPMLFLLGVGVTLGEIDCPSRLNCSG